MTRLSDVSIEDERQIRDFYDWVKERAASINSHGFQSDWGDAFLSLESDLEMRFPELRAEPVSLETNP